MVRDCGSWPLPAWARQVSNLRPLACKASALPLSYAPGVAGKAYPVGGGSRETGQEAGVSLVRAAARRSVGVGVEEAGRAPKDVRARRMGGGGAGGGGGGGVGGGGGARKDWRAGRRGGGWARPWRVARRMMRGSSMARVKARPRVKGAPLARWRADG